MGLCGSDQLDAQDSFEKFLSSAGKVRTIGAEQLRQGLGSRGPGRFQAATEQLAVFQAIVLRTRHCGPRRESPLPPELLRTEQEQEATEETEKNGLTKALSLFSLWPPVWFLVRLRPLKILGYSKIKQISEHCNGLASIVLRGWTGRSHAPLARARY